MATINQILTKLDFASVDADNAPDARRVLGQEATTLRAVVARGSARDIADCKAEVERVARMWGLWL